MHEKKYRLSYLPLFYEELNEKINYIAEDLKNPQAAIDLLNKVEEAILERLLIGFQFVEFFHNNYSTAPAVLFSCPFCTVFIVTTVQRGIVVIVSILTEE